MLAISRQRHNTDMGSRGSGPENKKAGLPAFLHVAERILVVRYMLTFFLFARAA